MSADILSSSEHSLRTVSYIGNPFESPESDHGRSSQDVRFFARTSIQCVPKKAARIFSTTVYKA